MPPQVSIIIPVFNKWELTANCLESIARHTPAGSYEVIAVDNASSDATRHGLAPLGEHLFGPAFRSLRFEENRNFGPGCNAGAQAAASDFLLFLNNDTVVQPGWLPPLLDAFKDDPGLGAAGPLLLYEDGTVQHLGVTIASHAVAHLYAGFPASHPVVKKRRSLQAITAAALLLPRELFFMAGGFYEGYCNGFEDVELCVRIRQRGKRLACIPGSVVTHLESRSPGRKNADREKNNAVLLKERCSHDLFIDLHHHGLRDGFSVVLDDAAKLCLVSSDTENKLLGAQAESMDTSGLQALAAANPLWLEGHTALAGKLEQEGKYAEAVAVWQHVINRVAERKEFFLPLKRMAAHSGNKELQNAVAAAWDGFLARSSPDARARAARNVIRRAGLFHDEFLQAAYLHLV